MAENSLAMHPCNRRDALKSISAALIALSLEPKIAAAGTSGQRVLVASNTSNGILAFSWNDVTGDLTPAGVAAPLQMVDWIAASAHRPTLFAACEVDSFAGRPTGEVASLRLTEGRLRKISARNSASGGTCHVAVDPSGRTLLAADYGGGSAASFRVGPDGSLSPVVWSEHYKIHGPNRERQQAAHPHFCSFSPDGRFAYINDLGGDAVHIYRLDPATAQLTPAGTYRTDPGAGPRTLHFHMNGTTAYCINELASTIDVLDWNGLDGSLTRRISLPLLPPGYTGPSRACDAALTRDGRFVYVANRDNNFLLSFRADPATGDLMPMRRSSCGGAMPRHLALSPGEQWMLVANQDSNRISIFARDAETGLLADEGKHVDAAVPMCLLFV